MRLPGYGFVKCLNCGKMLFEDQMRDSEFTCRYCQEVIDPQNVDWANHSVKERQEQS